MSEVKPYSIHTQPISLGNRSSKGGLKVHWSLQTAM